VGATTITGALAANGGFTYDTNRFTIADTTGNTAIAGTLSVGGETSLFGGLNTFTGQTAFLIDVGKYTGGGPGGEYAVPFNRTFTTVPTVIAIADRDSGTTASLWVLRTSVGGFAAKIENTNGTGQTNCTVNWVAFGV
jgi:hypothetical protein